MKSKKINLISNFKKFDLDSNFIFSAFNLAFIAYFLLGIINTNKNTFLWCDGLFGKIYSKSPKIPGNKFISFFYKYRFKEIIIVGNNTKRQINFLKKNFKTKVRYLNLPFINKNNVKKFTIKTNKKSLILITLPTPKQEMLATEISKKNKNFKIICIGGGLGIAAGDIKGCPKIIQNMGLEFIWRLNTDTYRRIRRLLYTFFIYLKNITQINDKIKIKLIN